nr:MAG TPA: hypothetical protein [Caudoviricetes sp.]
MDNIFNNEEMVNNGFKADGTFKNHNQVTIGQVVAAIIIFNVVGACVMKGTEWLKKRERAKKQVEVNNDIEKFWNDFNNEEK